MSVTEKSKKHISRFRIVQFALVLFDAVAVNLAYYIALFLRYYVNFEFNELGVKYIPAFWKFAPYYTIFCLLVFLGFRLYSRCWKFAGMEDMNLLLLANAVTCVGHVVGTLLLTMRMSTTYYILGALIQLALIALSRLSYRVISLEAERYRAKKRAGNQRKKVMVVGVGDVAHLVLRHMERDADSVTKPVCLVDYRSQSYGSMLEGIPVIYGVESMAEAVKAYHVEAIILADTAMPGIIRERVRELCGSLKIEVQDYVGYFQESWGSMVLTNLLAVTCGSVELVINGVHRQCANGQQAVQYITEQYTVKAMYAQNNHLVIELQTPLTLMYITNNPTVARIAEKNGVQRVWIDLETLGKEERQKGMNTVKSHHSIHDIEVLSNVLTTSKLLVRVNPMNPDSEDEINRVIAAGADIIMLPMWKSAADVKLFLGYVNGRVKTTLLLETREAAECLDQVLAMGGFDEIHIGLNDLHLSYGLTFMFELLANGMVESLCKKIAAAGIPYGFGGIARIGEGTLPAEWIVKEHYRLGSTRAILSRSFCDAEKIKDIGTIEIVFAENIARLRDCEHAIMALSADELEANREDVSQQVAEIVSRKKAEAAQKPLATT